MKESTLIKNLRSELVKLLPGVIIKKISDKATAGVPDLVVTHDDRTLWIETKVLTNYGTKKAFKKHINYLQLVTCCQLERVGRCFYVMQLDTNTILVVRPSKVLTAVDADVFDFYGDVKYGASAIGPLEDISEFLASSMGRSK